MKQADKPLSQQIEEGVLNALGIEESTPTVPKLTKVPVIKIPKSDAQKKQEAAQAKATQLAQAKRKSTSRRKRKLNNIKMKAIHNKIARNSASVAELQEEVSKLHKMVDSMMAKWEKQNAIVLRKLSTIEANQLRKKYRKSAEHIAIKRMASTRTKTPIKKQPVKHEIRNQKPPKRRKPITRRIVRKKPMAVAAHRTVPTKRRTTASFGRKFSLLRNRIAMRRRAISKKRQKATPKKSAFSRLLRKVATKRKMIRRPTARKRPILRRLLKRKRIVRKPLVRHSRFKPTRRRMAIKRHASRGRVNRPISRGRSIRRR